MLQLSSLIILFREDSLFDNFINPQCYVTLTINEKVKLSTQPVKIEKKMASWFSHPLPKMKLEHPNQQSTVHFAFYKSNLLVGTARTLLTTGVYRKDCLDVVNEQIGKFTIIGKFMYQAIWDNTFKLPHEDKPQAYNLSNRNSPIKAVHSFGQNQTEPNIKLNKINTFDNNGLSNSPYDKSPAQTNSKWSETKFRRPFQEWTTSPEKIGQRDKQECGIFSCFSSKKSHNSKPMRVPTNPTVVYMADELEGNGQNYPETITVQYYSSKSYSHKA